MPLKVRSQVDSGLWLHRFAIVVSVCTLALIFVGGLVTSTGSGLAVPDWPLAHGRLFPEMVGGVRYEVGHRMVAATVGLLTLVLALWLRSREPRRWVRRLGGLALVVVLCQAALGGVTVLLQLPTLVSVGHAALAQVFFCLTVCLAVFTSRSWQADAPRVEDPFLRTLALITTAAIFVQILLGALMRHTGSGLAIPDFPLSYGHLMPPFFTRQIAIHFAHRVWALVVTFFVMWLAGRILRGYEKTLRRAAIFLLAVLGVQIFLGAQTIWSSRAPVVTTLHVAGGALTLAASLYLTLRAYRILLPRAAALFSHEAYSASASE